MSRYASRELGNHFTVEAPACAGCIGFLRFRRFVRGLMVPSFALLIFSLLDPSVLKLMPSKLRSWVILLTALICFGPFIFWQFFGNQACRIESIEGLVRYSLRDQVYAEKFALLNNVRLSSEETDGEATHDDSSSW